MTVSVLSVRSRQRNLQRDYQNYSAGALQVSYPHQGTVWHKKHAHSHKDNIHKGAQFSYSHKHIHQTFLLTTQHLFPLLWTDKQGPWEPSAQLWHLSTSTGYCSVLQGHIHNCFNLWGNMTQQIHYTLIQQHTALHSYSIHSPVFHGDHWKFSLEKLRVKCLDILCHEFALLGDQVWILINLREFDAGCFMRYLTFSVSTSQFACW